MRKLRTSLGDFDYNVVVPTGKKLNFIYGQRLARVLARELPGVLKKKV